MPRRPDRGGEPDQTASAAVGLLAWGKAPAPALAGEGARVTICARSELEPAAAAEELRAETGAEVLTVSADLVTPDGIQRVVAATVERFGSVDVLVNNSGGPAPGRSIRSTVASSGPPSGCPARDGARPDGPIAGCDSPEAWLTVGLLGFRLLGLFARVSSHSTWHCGWKERKPMAAASIRTAGVFLVLVPTVAYGGVSLLGFISRRSPGYLDNPVRQNLFRAGHAHAGVLIILALVGLLYVDQADLGDGLKQLVRWCLAAAPVLMPLGFFLSVASPRAERPNRMILFTYAGGLLLAVGTLTLGIGLLRA
jgi:hypothetical protein